MGRRSITIIALGLALGAAYAALDIWGAWIVDDIAFTAGEAGLCLP